MSRLSLSKPGPATILQQVDVKPVGDEDIMTILLDSPPPAPSTSCMVPPSTSTTTIMVPPSPMGKNYERLVACYKYQQHATEAPRAESIVDDAYSMISVGMVAPAVAEVDSADEFEELSGLSAGGSSLKVEEYSVRANRNFSFPCPGANENTLVQYLEWFSESKRRRVLEYHGRAEGGAAAHGAGAAGAAAAAPGPSVYSEWQGRLGLDRAYGLVFGPTRSSDSGDYICLVNHRLMPDLLLRLNVIDVPDPPGRPMITSYTSRSANVSWTAPARINFSNITHYTVYIRKHNEKPDPDEDVVIGSKNFTVTAANTTNNETTMYISGLQPYTVYSFQVVAWNGIGPSFPSKTSYFMVTLSELPETRIIIQNLKNISYSSVYISWGIEDEAKINGDFLGFRVTWKPHNEPQHLQEKYIRNATITKHVITDLNPYTSYYVAVSVFNPQGNGPNTTILITTDEGPATPPRNLTVVDGDDDTVCLRWAEPARRNGRLLGYRIYFSNGNNTDFVVDKSDPDAPVVYFNITNLRPNTEYKIFVKAFSEKHEGQPSDQVLALTDISGPLPPKIKNISCEYNSSLTVTFAEPEQSQNNVEAYIINLYESGILYRKVVSPVSNATYVFQNVEPNTYYDVRVYGLVKSNRTGRLIEGEKSEFRRVYVSENCSSPVGAVSELWAGILVGVLCACAALFCAAGVIMVWKKYVGASYYYLDNTQCTPASLDWNMTPDPKEDDYCGPIPIEMFADHVHRLHADGDIGFSKEYEAIQNDPVNEVNSSENSQHPDNKPKNRYLNIIAYDHSRVQLIPLPGQKISTYINANYIDGFQVNRAYIGTQGPLPSTFDCFWRMIWEQRVTIIVMITNLVERGRRKCDMYWPKGTEDYGVIQVKLVKEDVMATYTVRTLVIRHTRVNVKYKKDATMAEKTVYQYHYTNWPDHGTPDHPLPVISFVRKSSAANPPGSGPIVVHCSAGVGRTGTYIVLDAMLKQISARGEVNIFGFLKHIRAQRNFLVQTEEQYIFIHDALVEAIECGETIISSSEFTKYIAFLQNLEAKDKNSLWKPLATQFMNVTSFKAKDFNLVSANKMCNTSKNRPGAPLPIESGRVHLTPRPAEDGSDYVNATWLPGFHSLREFIITQHPQEHTRTDFWRMCWDHAVQLVVVVGPEPSAEFPRFWPEAGGDAVTTDVFACSQVGATTRGPHAVRDLVMRSAQDDYEVRVRLVHCHGWPRRAASAGEACELAALVVSLQNVGAGPICVVDRYGATEAATLCALITFKKHLDYEKKVDVYMYAKLFHNKRPGIWSSADDYMKLHHCVQSMCGPVDVGAEPATTDPATMANGFNCVAPADGPSPTADAEAVKADAEMAPADFVRVPPEDTPLIPRDIQ